MCGGGGDGEGAQGWKAGVHGRRLCGAYCGEFKVKIKGRVGLLWFLTLSWRSVEDVFL